MNSNNKLKTIDLFAGAGGLSLGFLQTGRFQLVAAAEINPNARNTYAKNISDNNPEFEFIKKKIEEKGTGNNSFNNLKDIVPYLRNWF